MFNEPPKEFLYSAYKINAEYSDGINTINATATGFVLEIASGVPWIITNRHVVDLEYGGRSLQYKDYKLVKFLITGRKPDDTEYTFQLHENAKVYYHDDIKNDIVIIRAHVYFTAGDKFHWHFGLENLANKKIYNDLNPFDLICYSGFPNTHDKLSNRPILRSGNIASDPRFNYSWNNENQGQCVAYEGFSSPGASGSPIFAPSRGMVGIPNSRNGYLIGINAGHIPDNFGHSGISYFYKSTAILEIIEKNMLTEIFNKI